MRLYEGVLGRLPGSIKTNVFGFAKTAAKLGAPGIDKASRPAEWPDNTFDGPISRRK
jgi:hypothetical protein